VEKLEFK